MDVALFVTPRTDASPFFVGAFNVPDISGQVGIELDTARGLVHVSDGRSVVELDLDGREKWRSVTGYREHLGYIRPPAIHPEGRSVALAQTESDIVSVFMLNNTRRNLELRGLAGIATRVRWSSDGSRIFACSRGGSYCAWEADSGALICRRHVEGRCVADAVDVGNGEALIMFYADSKWHIEHVATDSEVIFDGFSPKSMMMIDGLRVSLLDTSGYLHRLDVSSIVSPRFREPISGVAWSARRHDVVATRQPARVDVNLMRSVPGADWIVCSRKRGGLHDVICLTSRNDDLKSVTLQLGVTECEPELVTLSRDGGLLAVMEWQGSVALFDARAITKALAR